MGKSLVELAAELVQAQCITRAMNPEELAQALQSAFCVLQALQAGEAKLQAGISEENAAEGCSAPEINPAKSIQKNKIICLECGQSFTLLSPKHLAGHGLTGREYRKKYGFPLRQPLCAKSLSERRKQAGKDRGVPENLLKAIAERKKRGNGKAKAARKTAK